MVLQINSNYQAIETKVNNLNSKVLDKIEDWLIEREGFTPEKAAKSRKEFLMFMSLAFLEGKNLINEDSIIPSKNADEFWHVFLLFNNKYNQWCTSKFGSIINHFPGQAEKNGWERTQAGIKELYGIEWTVAGSSSASMKEDLCDTDIWYFNT